MFEVWALCGPLHDLGVGLLLELLDSFRWILSVIVSLEGPATTYGSTTSTFLHIIIIICAAPPTNTLKAFWMAVAMAAWGAGEPAGRNAGRVCVDAVRYDGNVCVKYICRNVFVFLNPVGASVCFLWCWNSSVSYYIFIFHLFTWYSMPLFVWAFFPASGSSFLLLLALEGMQTDVFAADLLILLVSHSLLITSQQHQTPTHHHLHLHPQPLYQNNNNTSTLLLC